MRNFISLFFLTAFTFVFSQSVTVNWSGSKTEDYGKFTLTYPFFTNKGYEIGNGTVNIIVSEKSNGQRFAVRDLKWQKIPANELYDLPQRLLPDREVAGVDYFINPTDRQEYYSVKVSALRRENGSFYKLVSFDVNADNARRIASSSKKIGTTENPLKSGTFYKIKVDKSGIFKITKKFLSDNGINASSINPKNFRVYGNGGLALPEFNQDVRYSALQENAIEVKGEDDGVWNDEDYALFYAQGPHGFNVYRNFQTNNMGRQETRNDTSLHFTNIYEDSAYYFINFDLGPGKRVQTEDNALPASLITRYDDYQFIEEEKRNILKVGRIWVDDEFSSEKKVAFNKKSPIQPNDTIFFRASVVGYKSQSNKVKFNLNGTNDREFSFDNAKETIFDKMNDYQGSATGLSGNSLTFTITPNLSNNPTGSVFFDYAEVLYKEDLSFNDSQMNFRHYKLNENAGLIYGFSVSAASSAEQIWEVSDITNATRKTNKSGNNATFNFSYLPDGVFRNEFVAFKNSAAYEPKFVAKVDNQDLSALQNIDYLLVTNREMMGNAQRLADYHTEKSGFTTAVVPVDQIYNEYSSGSKDITAIRDFVSDLNNNKGGLKYLLILGDSSYDLKNKTSTNDNIVVSYVSEASNDFINTFITDDYFVMTNPQTDASLYNNDPTLPVGRLPASNLSEAKLLIDKTLAYYNYLPGQSSPFGEWRMKLNFVADDDADNNTPFHDLLNAAIVKNFEEGTERKEYNVRKYYLDAFPPEVASGGQRYPQVNQAISNDVGNSLYLFYFGHGGINGWAQERVLTLEEIENFNNFTQVYSRLPFVSTITCEFTLWDDPEVKSAGEQVIKHKTGGAATMITSSRAVSVSYGEQFTGIFTDKIFDLSTGDFLTLGDAHLAARKSYPIGRSNHFKVNYLGDPAMKLSRPSQRLSIDDIDSPVDGQLRALDFVKITGEVKKADGTLDESFNGRVAINIFDKRLSKKTRNNDNNPRLNPVLQYTEEGSAIVKASGKAVGGKYLVEFYVPKDINYEVGTGRILAYADNFETAKMQAFDVFANQPQQIGGINPDGINDNTAPKVQLYMNNINFADGGITDQNPTLLACVTDDTGINSTGSGIGHDITVILDGQIINTIILNDFYASGEGNGCVNATLKDYQKGNVTYPFRNLSPGNHQLVFKVWDINNNSTTATLNFVVKDEAQEKLVLNKLLNWPNPFTDKTYIHFEHNCDDILDVNVQIFTITGKLVRTFSTPVTSDPFLQGYRTARQAIEWDGRDDFGDLVGKGTYIYKVFARSQNQDKCKGGATAVEKMVILK